MNKQTCVFLVMVVVGMACKASDKTTHHQGPDDAGMSPNGKDAATGVDASSLDSGGTDGGGTDGGASCAMCTKDVFQWGREGGEVAFTEISALSPCGTYVHSRMPAAGGTDLTQCTNTLPCEGSGVITPADVQKAIENADVQAAIKAPTLFGTDLRPVDGNVFYFRFLYMTVEVGRPCSGSSTCKEIPAGVQAFVDLLTALDKQQLAVSTCATAFPATP